MQQFAAWNEENNKWYFSVLDIIGAIRKEDNYDKCRNYWKYLKAKLKKENSELVSVTTQLKLTAADGKKYMSVALDSDGVIKLAAEFPSKVGAEFNGWFTWSDGTILYMIKLERTLIKFWDRGMRVLWKIYYLITYVKTLSPTSLVMNL